MKLVTFLMNGDITPKIGVLVNDDTSIVVLETASAALDYSVPHYFSDMISFLSSGNESLEKASEVSEYALNNDSPDSVVSIESVSLLSPVPRPESIRDCMTFEAHIINIIRNVGLKKFSSVDVLIEKLLGRKRSIAYKLNKTFYERPVYYKSNRFSVVGHGADVIKPDYTEQLDYELEFGIFICGTGKDIDKRNAADYIGGYTIFNDFSARDIQLKEQGGRLGPAKGKDFDTGNAIGPCIVTPDEIRDPYALNMKAYVNGDLWSEGNSKDMYWSFEDIISYVSRSETLYPGEFIGSGTCSGNKGKGCGLEMNRFLNRGDVVELEVESIGVLRNAII